MPSGAAPAASGRAAHDGGGRVGAAVVHHEDLDARAGAERRPGAPSRAALAAPVQVAEQLVEGRADALRLVEGRQDDREGRVGGHRAQSSGALRGRCPYGEGSAASSG